MPSPALSSAVIEYSQTVISATLDTSVYIRALHFGGPATVIIGHARAGSIRIDISDAIVAETNRVLRDKLQWDAYRLQGAREKLLALGNHVSPSETLHVVKEDPDDDRILECAATANSDFYLLLRWCARFASEPPQYRT